MIEFSIDCAIDYANEATRALSRALQLSSQAVAHPDMRDEPFCALLPTVRSIACALVLASDALDYLLDLDVQLYVEGEEERCERADARRENIRDKAGALAVVASHCGAAIGVITGPGIEDVPQEALRELNQARAELAHAARAAAGAACFLSEVLSGEPSEARREVRA